jgi:hypothetical protein
MSSDTAQLLREHVTATAALLTNEKPDRKKEDSESGIPVSNSERTDTGKA